MSGPDPARATWALTATLALAGAALAATVPAGPLLTGRLPVAPLALAGALALLFLLTDLCLLHVEVRREAYSVTLAGVPLVLGVLLCDGRELIAARLLGSAVAFAAQRAAPAKAGYNLAAYTFEAALDVALVHLLVSAGLPLTVRTAVVCCLVLLGVDQLMSVLVVQVISWHQGRLTAAQQGAVHLPALVCSVLATTGAYGLLLLAAQGPIGVYVLVVFVAGAAVAYRAGQVLHRRHQALAHVHDFVGLGDDDTSVRELAGRMLEQVRALMRAGTAELVLTDPGGTLHLLVEEDGVPRPISSDRRAGDSCRWQDALQAGSPVLLTRTTRDRTAQAWLRARQVKDAVLVPLTGPGASTVGALMVLDRLGDTGSFTLQDQTLLQTLAGHLSVALSSGRRRERLRYEATHDVLTGLGNRALLHDAIHTCLADRSQHAGVLLLDLDRFKEVNDTLGHHVGDDLLRVVADRLGHALPGGATIARLGGDEFAALIPLPAVPRDPWCAGPRSLPSQQADPTDAHRRALADSAAAAARALAQPVELADATVVTRASIGVALATAGGTAADLLRHADTAMYAAKDGAGDPDGVLLYTPELDRGRAERLALLADLHLALDRHELHVLYQPKLDLATDQITSVEALVRWEHPRLGPLNPDVFIPLAEANGLISALTALVLAEALQQCAAWQSAGLELAVAVNLSARTVNDTTLPDQISAALLAAGVPASKLILEITESAVMDDPDRAVTILNRIAAIGVTLSLDDFGTGYSSLAYLQRLPVQEVKIDRSFITPLTASNPTSQVLVRSIIGLGNNLGLRIVAEGVEDADTLTLLQELGCHLIQGYHLSRPDTATHITALARTRARSARPLHAVHMARA